MKTLKDCLLEILNYDDGYAICTIKPFKLDNNAIICQLINNKVPSDISLIYFLDSSTAKEIMEPILKLNWPNEKIVEFLFFYGSNDAFPDWDYN